jgi:mannitol/fructose-specific phosphotransferase system IIA component (Ntr-type)
MTERAATAPVRRLFYYASTVELTPHAERLATAVAGMHQAEVVKLQRQTSFPVNWLMRYAKSPGTVEDAPAAAPAAELCGLVANWPDTPAETQAMLAAANQVKAPAYILRQAPGQRFGRIVVATAGGVHALHVLALAEGLSQAWNLPVSMLRIEQPPETAPEPPRRGLDALLARSFLLGRTIEIGRVTDLVRQIDAQAGAEDLLLIGAPHFGVAASHFAGSLPEQLARIHVGPMLMSLSEPPPSPPFRDFLWEANITMGVQGRDRDGVIRMLVDRLCESGLVPTDLRQTCVKRALAREALGSTVVGCQTALPHALLPDYDGVAAALAVCPAGVVFGSGEAAPKFIFLLVSSARSHDRYLGALARIARQMIDADTRQAVLSCATPTDVMTVLAGKPPD